MHLYIENQSIPACPQLRRARSPMRQDSPGAAPRLRHRVVLGHAPARGRIQRSSPAHRHPGVHRVARGRPDAGADPADRGLVPGVRAKVRRSGGQWGTGRTFAFIVLGLGFWAVATMGWPGVYESVLFYARATQTVLLVLVSRCSSPWASRLRCSSRRHRGSGARLSGRSAAGPPRSCFSPRSPRCCSSPCRWSCTSRRGTRHVFASSGVRELTYLILMVPGYAFFWTLLRVDPVPREYPYGVAMWITAAEVVGRRFLRHRGHRRPDDPRGRALPCGRLPLRPEPRHRPGHRRRHHLDPGRLRRLAVPRRPAHPDDARGQEEAEEIDAELDAKDAVRDSGPYRRDQPGA